MLKKVENNSIQFHKQLQRFKKIAQNQIQIGFLR